MTATIFGADVIGRGSVLILRLYTTVIRKENFIVIRARH